MFYSASNRGFYLPAIHGDSMPGDALEISDALHAALLEGQASGKEIVPDANGLPTLRLPAPPTVEALIAANMDALQAAMDARARAAGYDDVKSAISYADEPAVAKFQQEGLAFRRWRSLVWAKAIEELALIEADEAPMPSPAQAVASMPALELP